MKIDAQLPADLPEIEADPDLLGTAFEYVIDFALARSPRRTIHIGVEIVGGVPVLEVRDEGGPVEASPLDRLLEPFAEKELIPRAEPGQVLVSSALAELCLGKEVRFEDRGEATLKGFAQPVRVHSVRFEP